MGQDVSQDQKQDRDNSFVQDVRARDTRRRVVAGPQVTPHRGITPVRHYIEAGINSFEGDPYVPVFEDCLIKLAAGEEKYGSPLEIFNGRSADLDAYQDILDAINYQAQGFMEAHKQEDIVERANDLLITLKLAVRIRKRLVKEGIL